MKLHIGNISKGVTDAELRNLVVPFAEPSSLEIVRDHAGASKGFGFAEFGTPEEARAVITGLDGKDFAGQTLKLGEARPRKADAPKPGASHA